MSITLRWRRVKKSEIKSSFGEKNLPNWTVNFAKNQSKYSCQWRWKKQFFMLQYRLYNYVIRGNKQWKKNCGICKYKSHAHFTAVSPHWMSGTEVGQRTQERQKNSMYRWGWGTQRSVMWTHSEKKTKEDWERQHKTVRNRNKKHQNKTGLLKTVRARRVSGLRGKALDTVRGLTVIVSRALLPLISHDSHTLPLICADRPPYWNRLNFLS